MAKMPDYVNYIGCHKLCGLRSPGCLVIPKICQMVRLTPLDLKMWGACDSAVLRPNASIVI